MDLDGKDSITNYCNAKIDSLRYVLLIDRWAQRQIVHVSQEVSRYRLGIYDRPFSVWFNQDGRSQGLHYYVAAVPRVEVGDLGPVVRHKCIGYVEADCPRSLQLKELVLCLSC